MAKSRSWLIAFYALTAIAALIATFSQNLQLDAAGGPLGPYRAFLEGSKVNPAARSLAVDIGFFLLAATAFMVIEARRLAVRFVWLYIAGGFLIAISVTFPLFMIARERALARAAAPDAAKAAASEASWRLTLSDLIGLSLTAAAVLAIVAFVLT